MIRRQVLVGSAVAALLFAGIPAIASPSITITQLPLPAGAVSSTADAVNAHGTIVGSAGSAAVEWRANGTVTELPSLPGSDFGEAVDIDDGGTAVGDVTTDDGQQAVTWSPSGVVTALPPLRAGDPTMAQAINDDGTIAGNEKFAGLGEIHVIRWNTDGTVTDLGTGKFGHGVVTAMNAKGAITGGSAASDQNGSRAMRWRPNGKAKVLPQLPGAIDLIGIANDINDQGVMVGISATTVRRQYAAVTWDKHGAVTALATLPGGIDSSARSINDNGIVVGDGLDADGVQQAIRWSAGGAVSLLPTPTGSSDPTASAINDNGAIVGTVRLASGAQVAVRWR